MTAGVYALPDMVKATALQKVATFDAFTHHNDPYGEHDFGSFELCGRKFFWKIEYYDRDMQYGSEDGPASPSAAPRSTACLQIAAHEEHSVSRGCAEACGVARRLVDP